MISSSVYFGETLDSQQGQCVCVCVRHIFSVDAQTCWTDGRQKTHSAFPPLHHRHGGSSSVGENAAAGLEAERRLHPGVQPGRPAAARRRHHGETSSLTSTPV